MKRRRILYLICLLIVLGVNIFYVEYQIFIMLVLMLVIPACSWFVYFISTLGMGISMQIKKKVVKSVLGWSGRISIILHL